MPAPIGAKLRRVPTAVKHLKGTYNTSYANHDEPKLDFAIPAPPSHLNKHQTWAWHQMTKALSPMRVTTLEDCGALEMLAVAYSNYVLACDVIREYQKKGDKDFTYETRNTYGIMRRIKPAFTAMNEAGTALINLMGRFGLTPADRPRVRTIKDGNSQSSDPEEEFT